MVNGLLARPYAPTYSIFVKGEDDLPPLERSKS